MPLPLCREALSCETLCRETLSYEDSVWSSADVNFDGAVI